MTEQKVLATLRAGFTNLGTQMVRSILAGGLIANGLLFAAGIWRSVMAGKVAFHTLGDLVGGQGGLANIWLWPLTILLLCVVLVLANRSGAPKSRRSLDE